MYQLLKNVRFYVLLMSLIYSIVVLTTVVMFVPSARLQSIRLTQLYGLSSFFFLYVALLASPFCRTFPSFIWKEQYLKARRAIGVSAFYFASLHASLAFFNQLGGFEGLAFLSQKYLTAISLGFVSLVILFLMAITSFDVVINKLGFNKWKTLHRLVYLAGVFTLIHALMLGTHFSDLSEAIPQIMFSLVAILFILEAYQTDILLKSKFRKYPQFGTLLTLVIALVAIGVYIYTIPTNSSLSFGIHAQHIQLAKEVQQKTANSNSALQGDKTKRYTVSFKTIPEKVNADQEVSLDVEVYDASSGNPTKLFKVVYEKLMHMIIVSDDLSYFNHIHPAQNGHVFSVTTRFPKAGRYHVYVDYQPFGAIEQQQAFTLTVGNEITPTEPITADTSLDKSFGEYRVVLKGKLPFDSKTMSIGEQNMVFTVLDKDRNPIKSLKPYLGAFGHLVMINEKTFEYIHVHPTKPALSPLSTSGPDVEFMPIGLYGPIKPGKYKVFAQFNPNDTLFTADFSITIK